MPKNTKSKFYQYTVHCSLDFESPIDIKGLEQDDVDDYLNELKEDIAEKLQFNHQFNKLELCEGSWNDSDGTSSANCINCSFDFQESFIRSELEQDHHGGGRGDLSPTDATFAELTKEFQKLFFDYKPKSIEVFADFTDLMSVEEETEDRSV